MKDNKLVLLIIAMALAAPVYAGDIDGKAILGGAIGGGAGAGVGSAIGGREGAIIGGGIGGAAGAAIATRPKPQVVSVERRVVHVERHHHHDNGRHLGHYKHKHKHQNHDD